MSTVVVAKIANSGGAEQPLATTDTPTFAGGTFNGLVTDTQAVAATSTDGLLLQTSATATVGAQKLSPAVHFKASGWGTGGGAAQSVDWRIEAQPIQGTNPTTVLSFQSSINGGAYTARFTTNSAGDMVGGPINAEDGYVNMFTTTAFALAKTLTKRGCLINTATAAFRMGAGGIVGWNNNVVGSADVGDTSDTCLTRISAGVVGVGSGAAASFAGTIKSTTALLEDANGGQWIKGQASELLTLNTGGLTTDTSANLLPANSIIEAVVCRVTTTITTTTNWAVGDPTTAARFSAANATKTAGTTSVGIDHWSGAVTTLAAGPSQAAAAKVRITCTGSNPGAGAIRITVFYRQFVAPTS